MTGSATNALIFIIHSFTQLYLLVLLLRLLLPWLRANFNNPIAQAILRVTSPLVVPLRRVIPAIGRLDTATVVVAFSIQYLTILIIATLRGWPLNFAPIAVTSAVNLVTLTIWLFIVAIIIRIVMSWMGGGAYNPAMGLIDSLAEPVLRPVRRVIRPAGGIDLSSYVAIVFLIALTMLLSGLKMLPI